MNVRTAKISDARAINTLINDYAEQDRMLYRSLADIYENLQSFCVAEDKSKIIGCCCLAIIWSDLAEIKSLAVDKTLKGKGVGKALVEFSAAKARELDIAKIFALTMEPEFFEKIGFEKVEKDDLPMKVWSDCARCPKQNHCDETAFIKNL
jgi:amino-acid N-acetyltransferase